MASNGYVRRQCSKCIFYRSDREYGEECILYDELWEADHMFWVSANDYNRSPEIRAKHDEKCKHFISKKEVRNMARKQFGIKTVE